MDSGTQLVKNYKRINMKIVIQRVHSASVSLDGEPVSKIGKGLLLLCGFTHTDTDERLEFAANRISKMRIFRDENGKLNRSVIDEGGEVLVVSNFTLYGNALHGNRPDFGHAAGRDIAFPLYERLIDLLNERVPTKKGAFGERMQLDINADGPVTLILEL